MTLPNQAFFSLIIFLVLDLVLLIRSPAFTGNQFKIKQKQGKESMQTIDKNTTDGPTG